MEKENIKIKKEFNGFSPKKAIIIIILLALIIPFLESKKAINWQVQQEGANHNFFSAIVLSYARWAEATKGEMGLASSSEKQYNNQPSPGFVESQGEGEINIVEKPPLAPFKIEAPFRILIIGDSFIGVRGGTGEILETELISYKDVVVKRSGVVSSGLSRPDYFDWSLKAQQLIAEFKPNIVFVMLGSNDAQGLIDNIGRTIAMYKDAGWEEEYANRVSSLLNIFESNKVAIFWIELPIMANKAFSNRIKGLNSIYEKELAKCINCHAISIWQLLANHSGGYAYYLKDENNINKVVRLSDGIHFTLFGGQMVVEEAIKQLKENISLETK